MKNQQINRIIMRWVRIPLETPYWSMISTLYELDSLIAEVHMEDGKIGYGEAAIVNGYTHETMEDGWKFCINYANKLAKKSASDALATLNLYRSKQSHAVTCLTTAIEMACEHPILHPMNKERCIPIVGAIQNHDPAQIKGEVEALLDKGYQTFKVKVGMDVSADLERVKVIHAAAAGAAVLRLDANQGYSPEDACTFASKLPAEGIELFEQGSAADDWAAAKAIADVSTVPTMLDESIFDLDDIDRAAKQQAAALIKLKLVKCGGITALQDSLSRIRMHSMGSVLGNGVSGEIGNWMEACVADDCIERTGEMNGFMRLQARLFHKPLTVREGQIILPANYYPEIDQDALEHYTVHKVL